MELFDYLMAKKGHNTHRDLFSYLLGKNAGGSGTYTTFSGISLNISNTLQAKIKNIALEGNTSQDGTPTPDTPIPIKVVTGEQNVEISGKNLFNLYDHTNTLDDYTTIISPNKYTCNASSAWKGRVIVPISNFKKNTDYTFSYTSNSTRTYINEIRGIKDGVTTIISNGAYYYYVKKFTINTSDYDKIVIDMYARGNGGTATQVTISNLQLEEGSQATEFVPYQSQTYPISLASKNLFKPYTNSGSVTSKGVVYTMNNDNTITINGTATGSTWVEILANFINTTSTSTTKYLNLDNTKNYILKVTVLSGAYTGTVRFYAQTNSSGGEVNSYIGNSSSITNSDGLYRAWLRVDSGVSFENCKIGIQLEQGTTATDYTPYYNIEYCKIGDYADQISNQFESKNLFDYHWFGSTKDILWTYYYNLLGQDDFRAIPIYIGVGNSATFSSNVPQTSPSLLYGLNGLNIPTTSDDPININHSSTKQANSDGYVYLGFVNTRQYYQEVANGTYYIQIEIGSTATEYIPYGITNGEWYLKKNIGKINSYNGETIMTGYISTTGGLDTGATVYYGVTTPQYIHITPTDYPTLKAQLDNLYNNAKSYNGQTNITQTNDDLPFNISVDVKVTSANLSMSNSLNSSLLNENIDDIQNEEETNLDDINEIEEPIEEYEEL